MKKTFVGVMLTVREINANPKAPIPQRSIGEAGAKDGCCCLLDDYVIGDALN